LIIPARAPSETGGIRFLLGAHSIRAGAPLHFIEKAGPLADSPFYIQRRLYVQ
jgi:hypothetical protein